MKRLFAVAATLASGLALTASAQMPAASTAAHPTKIAVVAFQVAVAQTNEFQRNFADLQKKYDPRRQEIKTLSDQVDALTKDLEAQASKLSETERASRATTIDNKKKQLQRDSEDAQNDYQQDMQQLFNAVAQKVGQEMIAYAQQHGYTAVLDFGQQQSQVLWAADSTNITKEVVEAYNQKSGIPAPPAQSALPAAPAPAAH